MTTTQEHRRTLGGAVPDGTPPSPLDKSVVMQQQINALYAQADEIEQRGAQQSEGA